METQNKFKNIIWKLSHWPIIAWAIILIAVAFILVEIHTDFTIKLAILPGVLGLLLFYQAIFRGKMY